MPSPISTIETLARQRLIEVSASYWTSPELLEIIYAGIRDLWRDIVDLKQEHYLKNNNTDVYYDAQATTISGLPSDIHKVYMIEPRDLSTNGTNHGLQFKPLDYNHETFQAARALDAITPTSSTIFYCITGQGAPVNAPVIECAPQVSSGVLLRFVYVPTLGQLISTSSVPIPGEADNALVAWTVAFARAKEREDRSPDPNWLSIYATEKQHLLESLGQREYQEPKMAIALFESYWG